LALHCLARLCGGARSPQTAQLVWPLLHSALPGCVAGGAERLAAAAAAAARGGGADPLDAAVSLGALLSFYALHAPGGADAGAEAARCGLLRSAAAALAAAPEPPPPLRRGLLLLAAASPAAAAFLAAVPGAHARLGARGCAEGGLWPLVVAGGEAPGCAARLAEALEAQSPAAPEALALLLAAMRCGGAARRLWRPGGEVHSALLGLQAALRRAAAEGEADEAGAAASAGAKAAARAAALRHGLKEVLALGGGGGKAD